MIPLRDDNPVRRSPLVTWAIVFACAAIFAWQASLGDDGFHRAIIAFGTIPAVLFGHVVLPPEFAIVPPALTLVTSMFLHGGWLHLGGNMLFLWIFGDNVEDRMGRVRFLAFYLACGVAAVLAQVFPATEAMAPIVGASGAISGVLGAYLLMFPRSHVLVLLPFRVLWLPAPWVLGLWFLVQLVASLSGSPEESGVAFRAHLGGFVAGLAFAPLFLRGRW